MKKIIIFVISIISISGLNAQWTQLILGTNANFQDICVSLTDNNYIFVAGGEEMFKSTDEGDSWTEMSQSFTTTLWGISFPTNNIGYVCSNDGYVLKTTDGGNSWSVSLQLSSGGFDRVSFKDAMNGIASGTAIYTTSDGGANWTKTQDNGYWGLDYAEGDVYYANSLTQIKKTLDNGATWTGLKNDINALFGTISFYDDTHGLTGDAGKVWLSDDGGLSWTEYTSPGFGINRAAVRLDYDTSFISGEDGLIYKTTDHGDNWTLDADFSSYFFRDMTINSNNTTLFICGFQGIVARKTYAASEPNPEISVDPTELVFDTIPVNDTTALLLTVTNTGGQTLVVDSIVSDNDYFWTLQGPFNLTADQSISFDVYFSPRKAGDASGLLHIYNNTTFTSNKTVPMSGYGDETVGIPDNNSFNGFTIYPNPASGSIFIKSSKETEGDLDISIFTLDGKLVGNSHHSPGVDIASIDISYIEDGLYLVAITNNKRKYISKLIIKR
jgi:photosystem II stability/assembly factor-like uncharacterized protein